VNLLAVLQGVVERKNNILVYNPVSVSFNIKVFTADSQSPTYYGIMKTKITVMNTHGFSILNAIKYY